MDNGAGDNNAKPLHIFFLPHLARGHMIPLLDTARLLAKRGAHCTFVTTSGNSSIVSNTIAADASSGLAMDLLLLPFPDVGLPPGCENTATIPAGTDAVIKLYNANRLLREPFESLLRQHSPDAVIADVSLVWPADVAESLSLPHVQFNVTSPFSTVLTDAVISAVQLDNHVDPLTVTTAPLPGLPRIVLQRSELPMQFTHQTGRSQFRFMEMMEEAGRKSLGVIYNTFRGLEGDWLANITGRNNKLWCVGPLQLGSVSNTGAELTKNWDGIKKWLDGKELESVVYVSFGTECHLSREQLRELAIGLEGSGHSFVWVVRGEEGTMEEWLPEGFEEKVGGKGLVITGWAPQFLILNHPAVGASVLHCGWNSAIECVCAGLPVIAWPLHSEQFLSERLFVDVLRIGVRVLEGEMRVERLEGKKVVSGEKVREAVGKVLGGGEEVKEMRRKAKEYGKMAKMAVGEGGSSYLELSSLFQELTVIAQKRRLANGAKLCC